MVVQISNRPSAFRFHLLPFLLLIVIVILISFLSRRLTLQFSGMYPLQVRQILIGRLVSVTLKHTRQIGGVRLTFQRDLPHRLEPLEILINVLAALTITPE